MYRVEGKHLLQDKGLAVSCCLFKLTSVTFEVLACVLQRQQHCRRSGRCFMLGSSPFFQVNASALCTSANPSLVGCLSHAQRAPAC